MIELVIWVALLIGAAASAAALYGHYWVLPGWLTGPQICQLEHGGCAVLFRSPRARLLGVPNAGLGLSVYAVLAVGLIAGWPRLWLFALTVPAVAMSAFLGYSLLANQRQCRICWAGHVANLVLAASLAWSATVKGDSHLFRAAFYSSKKVTVPLEQSALTWLARAQRANRC